MSYWRTMKGLLARIADIAHHFTWKTLNMTMKEIVAIQEVPALPAAPKAERIPPEKIIVWKTMEDAKVCPICTNNAGEYDVEDPFLPDMPAHINCRCYWEVRIVRAASLR